MVDFLLAYCLPYLILIGRTKIWIRILHSLMHVSQVLLGDVSCSTYRCVTCGARAGGAESPAPRHESAAPAHRHSAPHGAVSPPRSATARVHHDTHATHVSHAHTRTVHTMAPPHRRRPDDAPGIRQPGCTDIAAAGAPPQTDS